MDIAKHLNLSKSTVSKALNGYPDVSLNTRELVMRTALEMGYQPNTAARNLSRGRTEKIGLFLNTSVEYVTDYLSGIMSGAVRQSQELGKNFIIYTMTNNNPQQLLQVCRGGEIDGVILFSTHYDDHTIKTLLDDKFPFVVMGRQINDERVSYVVPDYYDGGYQGTQYLIDKGHRHIGFMTRPELTTANDAKLQGHLDALQDNNIDVDNELIIETKIELDAGIVPTQKLLSAKNPPTAIFAFHDLLAVDTLTVLNQRGYNIPEDIAVIGFDGLRAGLMTSPRITTVQQPLQLIGKRVIEIVNHQIENNDTKPVQETVPVELIIREST